LINLFHYKNRWFGRKIKVFEIGVKICLLLFVFNTKAHAQNYDESKVPAYTLPEVLNTSTHKPVTNRASWQKLRRPEILKLFEDNVYGQMPNKYDSIKFTLTRDDLNVMAGKAHFKEVQIAVWKANKCVIIHLILFIPNHIKKPVPAFLLINNRDRNNTDPSRTIKSEFWPTEMLIDSGYAIAAFHVSDTAPDDSIHYKDSLLQLYPEQLTADNGMKAIGAWAWGASRVMDYFVQQQDIDGNKVFVVGHSRGGKAALWAGAEDQRFAIVFSNCSGNTGAALSRRKFGETISRINDHFPHWFCNNYKKYNDNEAALPVDQHMLISLIAPRPVYVTSASKDLWADPKGSYLSLINAQKVYSLYGSFVSLPTNPPPINTPVRNAVMGYHNREGIHNLTAYDWGRFISFANYHFKKIK
jgi:hypothetical protein